MSAKTANNQTQWTATTSPLTSPLHAGSSDCEATSSRCSTVTRQWLKHFWLNNDNRCWTSVTPLHTAKRCNSSKWCTSPRSGSKERVKKVLNTRVVCRSPTHTPSWSSYPSNNICIKYEKNIYKSASSKYKSTGMYNHEKVFCMFHWPNQ